MNKDTMKTELRHTVERNKSLASIPAFGTTSLICQ